MSVLPSQPLLIPEKDPMGQAIKDYFEKGDDSIEVTVLSDFSEPDVIPASLLFRNESEMPELEREALKNCHGKILDIGAGSGSHVLALQEKGLDVTALDISPLSIEVMKKRGIKNVLQANIFEYDETKYDTLLMLMNGIGLVSTLDGLQIFLEHVKKILKPDGQLIFDSSDIIYLHEDEDGSYLIDISKEYYGQLEYQMQYKDILGDKFGWLYISYPVLEEYAEQAGFQVEALAVGDHFDYLAKLTLK